MNLRVDLIFENEQRSASLLNLKSITRVLAITIPSIILIIIALFVLDMMKINGELKDLEEAWANSQPKQQEAMTIAAERKNNLNTVAELEGWHDSRLTWNEQMLALMRIVHINIQLTTLTTTETVAEDEKSKIPTRFYKMMIEGETAAVDAEQIVNKLQDQLQKSPPFDKLVNENGSSVIRYERKKDGGANDRSFTIQCSYKPREYK